MRAVVQRVSSASVVVDGKTTGSIDLGFLILLGVEQADTDEDVTWLANKILALRVFGDEEGKMNKDIADVEGNVLVVSQFTLHAKYKKGNRPSFIRAAEPSYADRLYIQFSDLLAERLGKPAQRGVFGAHMDVHLTNDGPVTMIMDTKNKE